MISKTAIVLCVLACGTVLAAQAPATPATAAGLSVFLDCQDGGCDQNFFRTEITAVNWVRDRAVADVHILVTRQSTGAGGTSFAATFIGLRRFVGLVDTLQYVQPPASTSDEQRQGVARMLRAGLVRYIARTPEAGQLRVSFGEGRRSPAQTSTAEDPWRAWVFRISTGGNSFAEESFSDWNINGNFSANRITEKWKTQIRGNGNRSESNFKAQSTVVHRSNLNFSVLHVRSVGSHMAVGVRGDAGSSTYANTRRSIRVGPAIEYNIFPYSQSTRRVWKFEYAAGIADFAYSDTTVFDLLAETRPWHRVKTSASQRQPWGQVDGEIVAFSYLHDHTKYRLSGDASISVRLFKGFNVNFGGGYESIQDQLGLLKKSFTPQQILLRQFQQGTRYAYFFHTGISYTFGSIFNNVVNPRFD